MRAQSCPTLCDPMDCNTPGSSVHGIFQERIMEWIADSYFRGPGNQVIINTFPACLFGPGVSKVIWPRPSLIPPSEKFFAIHQGLLWLLKGISCGITPISVVFGHCPKWIWPLSHLVPVFLTPALNTSLFPSFFFFLIFEVNLCFYLPV